MRTLHQLLLLCLLLLSAGCEARLDVTLDLDADGSGRLEVAVAADRELQAEAEALGVDPLGRAVERIEQAGSVWRASVEDAEDGSRVARISTAIDDPAEVQLRIEELRAALATDEATLLGPLQVAVDEEARTITVQGQVVAQVGQVAAADAGMTVEELTDQLDGVISSSLTVNAPGPLLEELAAPGVAAPVDPADPESPVVLRWEASAGQAVPVVAFIEQPATDLVRLLLQAGVGVLAALAIVGGIVAQRRR